MSKTLMKFSKFLETMKDKYNVRKLSKGRYSISNGERDIEVHESNTYDPTEIDQFLSGMGPAIRYFGHVGQDDLFPDFRRRDILRSKRKIKGSYVDPSSDIFHSVGGSSSSDDSTNPLINVDPITPSRKNKRGFDPDPDHYKKPDGGSKFP